MPASSYGATGAYHCMRSVKEQADKGEKNGHHQIALPPEGQIFYNKKTSSENFMGSYL
jgi:hypothetical protein